MIYIRDPSTWEGVTACFSALQLCYSIRHFCEPCRQMNLKPPAQHCILAKRLTIRFTWITRKYGQQSSSIKENPILEEKRG